MVETFKDATQKYTTRSLQIRKTLIQEAGGLVAGLDEADDAGSMFSVGSHSSNISHRRNTSSGSLGSVTSISSVISVGAQSTFTMSSQHDINKHKSKFNKIGREKNKGGKAKRGRQRFGQEARKT